MRTVNLNGKTVEIYDSIDTLPVLRFHKYNKMVLIDSGLGSDLASFDLHLQKAFGYIKNKDSESAIQELENLRQNYYLIHEGVNAKHLSFCCLVKSIDGVEYNDLSPSGLEKVLSILAETPHSEITSTLEDVKKKIDQELSQYFPNLFDDSAIKEFFDELRKRTILALEAIKAGDHNLHNDEISKIDLVLLTYNKPPVFYGAKNVEVEHDKAFENMCLIISEHTNVNPKNQTVLSYYSAFEYIKQKFKANKPA